MLKSCVAAKSLAVAILMLSAPTQQAQAGIQLPSNCKLPHIKVHYGVGLRKSAAKRRAHRKWQRHARQVHSWSYRKWSKAHKRRTDCHKSGRWWKCAAGAYACR